MKNSANIILTFLVAYLFVGSCCCNVEESICSKSGEIIFYEYKECLCCPGWVIKTGEDTIKTELLPNQDIVLDEIEKNGYPVLIEFEYIDTTGICNMQYKKITCLEIIKH
ncbi:MAG: hypothetical protein IPH57_10480 [Saprospiraceae bacterium]|nr:hypothetical protein [Saprospiraceae bacterium]